MLELWDTARRGLVALPDRPDVRLYVCGVTPYDTTHLGHAFTYTVFDSLISFIEAEGRRVVYTQNVTDVDDPLFAKARELRIPAADLARREVDRFLDDLRALEVRPPDHHPWASETVPQMIDMINTLLQRGNAYEVEGRVYFDVTRFPRYGELSRLSHRSMVRKLRADNLLDDHRRDPLDFLLWRPSLPDEPSWKAPFGAGRPGWHIECSAMAMATLGPQIDIHGGGRDLVFSHHESEIAQSESCSGLTPFARIWMHTGLVRYEGHKMSKSLGNLVLVRDVLQRHSAQALRWYLLNRSFRRDWTFEWPGLAHAESMVRDVLRALDGNAGPARARDPQWDGRIRARLARGPDTRGALSALHSLATLIAHRGESGGDQSALRGTLRHWGRVLKVVPAD